MMMNHQPDARITGDWGEPGTKPLEWAPSLRALIASNSYDEYLALMAQHSQQLIDSVDLALLNGEDL